MEQAPNGWRVMAGGVVAAELTPTSPPAVPPQPNQSGLTVRQAVNRMLDPSNLPAIEQHINELRADRETALAMGAAEFVNTALTAQITAYQRVIDRMHKHLGSLPASERAQMEEASTVLRKARAGDNHTLLPLTIARPKDPR